MFYRDEVDPSKDAEDFGCLKYATEYEISAIHDRDAIVDELCTISLRTVRLKSYLTASPHWSTEANAWKGVSGKRELPIVIRAYQTIIDHILTHFGLAKPFSGGRKAWVTCNEAMGNFKQGDFPVPNICATGKGDYLSVDKQDPSNPSYEQSLFFCLVQPHVKFVPRSWQPQILEPLARYIFYAQAHRRFFRVLLLSQGGHMRLFHFDRSGCINSATIDINENPVTFARTILSLSSHDAAAAGFDPDIFWKWEYVGPARVRQGYICMC
ncbi:other/FunK1 protein kinase [Coprinopsis cinerea AmutBmut pab1-1]|nr:other/FunK1 protein kinase [Coprinopsis cinerea AmutBmut pab1-1]